MRKFLAAFLLTLLVYQDTTLVFEYERIRPCEVAVWEDDAIRVVYYLPFINVVAERELISLDWEALHKLADEEWHRRIDQ